MLSSNFCLTFALHRAAAVVCSLCIAALSTGVAAAQPDEHAGFAISGLDGATHYLQRNAPPGRGGVEPLPRISAIEFDQDVTPDVIFGSTVDNGSFTVDRRNGIELALRGKLRFNESGQPENTFNSNGDGTYGFVAGQAVGQSAQTPVWAFEWSINTDHDDSSGLKLDDLRYELGLDGDPSIAVEYLIFDPVTPVSPDALYYDHAIGDNATGNGDGTVAADAAQYSDLLADYNVAQNSWRYSFFLEDALAAFDPTVDGHYRIYLSAIDAGTDEVLAHVEIVILVGDAPLEMLVRSISETGDTASPADNDFTRIDNAIQAVSNDSIVRLQGLFDWTETHAMQSWEAAGYWSFWPADVHRVTITADELGDAVIQGPGDLPELYLEGVFGAYGPNQGWEVSNLSFLDFDLTIGMFHVGSVAPGVVKFNDTRIVNNHIRMATDVPGDDFQNIGIHFSFGDNQLIAGNRIEIPGDGHGDTGSVVASVAMQSNTSSGAYQDLVIEDNVVQVLNAQAGEPEAIVGIWENGGAHTRNITVRNNVFENLHPGNDAALNSQEGFRLHSHSSASTTTLYQGNRVSGARIAYRWLPNGYGADLSAREPIAFTANIVEDSDTAVALESNGAGLFRDNDFSGSVTGIRNDTAAQRISDAQCNWWGHHAGPAGQGPGVGASVDSQVLYDPWLSSLGGVCDGAFTAPATVYVDDDFAGASPGDELVFVHPELSEAVTVTYGYDAFASVAAGIDAIAEGGVVLVADGHYSGTVTISRPLTLGGSGAWNTTTLEGGLRLSANNITVTGFAIHNGGALAGETAAIYIDGGTSGHVIRENVLLGENAPATRGIISGAGASDIQIADNEIIDWTSGIYINPSESAGIVISGNTISGNVAGVGGDQYSGVIIEDNVFSGNQEGIGYSGSADGPVIGDNLFENNAGHVVSYPPAALDAAQIHDANAFDLAILNYALGQVWGQLQPAVAAAETDGTLVMMAGTYHTSGQLLIDRNLRIHGDDPDDRPVIAPQTDLTGGNASGAWFLVDENVIFELADVVLDGDGHLVQQGIRNHGHATIHSVSFRNIHRAPYSGIAILSFGGIVEGGGGADSHGPPGLAGSTLTVEEADFEQIGRIGILVKGTDAVAEATGITYTGKGIGDHLDYAFEAGAGGTLAIADSMVSNNRGEASSDGSASAGVLVTTFYGDGSSVTLENTILTDNTSAIALGYGAEDSSVLQASGNRIFGNDDGVITSSSGIVAEATCNWWGDASGPGGAGPGTGDSVSVQVQYYPWNIAPDGNCAGGIPDTVYVDDDFAGAAPGSTVGFTHPLLPDTVDVIIGLDGFASITNAVDAVLPDGTVYVTDGDYTENVQVEKSLQLLGAQAGVDARGRSADEARLTGSIEVLASVDTVTIDGFAIEVTVPGPLSNTAIAINAAEVAVINNIVRGVTTSGPFTRPGIIDLAAIVNATIAFNDLELHYSESGQMGIRVVLTADADQIEVANNHIANAHGGALGIMNFDNADVAMTIEDNVFRDGGDGLWLAGPGWGPMSQGGFQVVGNEFYENAVQINDLAEILDLEAALVDNTFDRAAIVRENPIVVPVVFSRIQAAIDAASDGNLVEALAGEYQETLSIDKSLTLVGANAGVNPNTSSRAPETVITGPSGANLVTVPASTADAMVMLDGFTVSGGNRFFVNLGADNTITLSNNRFVDGQTGAGQSGHILLNYTSSASVEFVFTDNYLADNNPTNGLFSWPSAAQQVTITGNVWDGQDAAALNLNTPGGVIADNQILGVGHYGFLLGGSSPGLLIENNVFDGIRHMGESGPDSSWGTAIRLFGTVEGTINIVNNVFSNMEIAAIKAEAGAELAAIAVTDNQITDNASGIINMAGLPLQATCNWWGHASGPGGAGPGLGDTVSGDVLFLPWHTAVGGPCAGDFPDVVYVDDDFAGATPGDTVTFAHPELPGSVSATFAVDAFDTIAGGLAAVAEHGLVLVAEGDYAGGSFVFDRSQSVLGAGREATVISASGDVILASDDIEIAGLQIDGYDAFRINPALEGVANITIRDNWLRNGNQHGITVDGYNWRITENVIENAGQILNHLGIIGGAIAPTDDIFVRGNEIRGSAASGVYFFNGSGIVLLNNTVEDNGAWGAVANSSALFGFNRASATTDAALEVRTADSALLCNRLLAAADATPPVLRSTSNAAFASLNAIGANGLVEYSGPGQLDATLNWWESDPQGTVDVVVEPALTDFDEFLQLCYPVAMPSFDPPWVDSGTVTTLILTVEKPPVLGSAGFDIALEGVAFDVPLPSTFDSISLVSDGCGGALLDDGVLVVTGALMPAGTDQCVIELTLVPQADGSHTVQSSEFFSLETGLGGLPGQATLLVGEVDITLAIEAGVEGSVPVDAGWAYYTSTLTNQADALTENIVFWVDVDTIDQAAFDGGARLQWFNADEEVWVDFGWGVGHPELPDREAFFLGRDGSGNVTGFPLGAAGAPDGEYVTAIRANFDNGIYVADNRVESIDGERLYAWFDFEIAVFSQPLNLALEIDRGVTAPQTPPRWDYFTTVLTNSGGAGAPDHVVLHVEIADTDFDEGDALEFWDGSAWQAFGWDAVRGAWYFGRDGIGALDGFPIEPDDLLFLEVRVNFLPDLYGTTVSVESIDDTIIGVGGVYGEFAEVLEVLPTPATIDFAAGDLVQVYDGTVKTVAVTTAPEAGLDVFMAFDPDPPVEAGSYQIDATITDPYFTGGNTATLQIEPAPADILLSDLLQTYTGEPLPVSVMTIPADLDVIVTYDGMVAAPVDVGTYDVIASVDAPNYAGTASDTLQIVQAAQLIDFAPLPDRTIKDSPFLLVASASSGLAVSFEVISGPASIDGDEVTLTGALGEVVIEATQGGDGNWLPADAVQQSFQVIQGVGYRIEAASATVISGQAGQPVDAADLPTVRVVDSADNPVSGAIVSFGIVSGGGSVSDATQVTDEVGLAQLGGWTLGSAETQVLHAASPGLVDSPIEFSATVQAVVQLSVTVTNELEVIEPGARSTYVIVVENHGPNHAEAVALDVPLPATLDNADWQCIPALGAACEESGSGDIAEVLAMPANSSVTVLLSADVIGGHGETIELVASATFNDATVEDTDGTLIVSTVDTIFEDRFEVETGAVVVTGAAEGPVIGHLQAAGGFTGAVPPVTLIGGVGAAGESVFEVSLLNHAGLSLASVSMLGVDGQWRHSPWIPFDGGNERRLTFEHDALEGLLFLIGERGELVWSIDVSARPAITIRTGERDVTGMVMDR